MGEMRSDTRARYEIARSQLDAMKTSTTSAEFSASLLAFLTFSRSVIDVARAEAVRHSVRQPTKHRIEGAENELLVKFFVGARNDALHESRYESMRTTVTIDPGVAFRLQISAGDALISPSRGIDESKEPRAEEVVEIGVREEKQAQANVRVNITQEFYFTSGPYSGQSVIHLSEQFLGRLETIVNQVEQSIGSKPLTNPSSGSAR